MNRPLISILMPAYNAEKFVAYAIQSVIDQTYSNWELLVLDDGSSDKTGQIIQAFNDGRIRVFQNQENQGYLKSCNKLFGYLKGDFVTFQDADDLQYPHRLNTYMKTFTKDPSLDFITSDHERIDASGRHLKTLNIEVDYKRMATDVHYRVYYACATLIFRSKLLDSVHGYHPFFEGIGGEDYHLIWSFSKAFKGEHLNECLYRYRLHDQQNQFTSTNPLKFLMARILTDIRVKTATGNDPLRDFATYRQFWDEFARNNRSLITLGISNQLLQQGKSELSMLNAIKAIIQNPTSVSGWKTSYSICRKNILAVVNSGS